MRYVSTRGAWSDAPQPFTGVLLEGLAPDGGLAVPERYPHLSAAELTALRPLGYRDLAYAVLSHFIDDIPLADLRRIVNATYTREVFGSDAITPLVTLEPGLHLLRVANGPTLAFKDIALQLLGRLFEYALARERRSINILGATSGDTGGAAIEAFRGRARTDLFVLFPQGRISDVQRRMMTTAGDDNVHALAIEGTFDDCQAIVKGMFNHHAFSDRARLSGVNSINWARIVAQVVYYFTAAVVLGAPHRKVAFTVPTGNFGDVYAGYVARCMGLPVDRLVIATNVNDILARTIATGTYDLRDVIPTSSPSMDIQVASNFERLLFDAYDRDSGAVRALMASLSQSQRFALSVRALSGMREVFSADRADEDETAAAIRTMRRTS